MGASGVTILSESHISIHTWPERSFASIDVFMCGNCDPQTTINYLEKTLKSSSIDQSLNRRMFHLSHKYTVKYFHKLIERKLRITCSAPSGLSL